MWILPNYTIKQKSQFVTLEELEGRPPAGWGAAWVPPPTSQLQCVHCPEAASSREANCDLDRIVVQLTSVADYTTCDSGNYTKQMFACTPDHH